MPIPDLPRLRPGQMPSASDWNALCDALAASGIARGDAFGDVGTSVGRGGVQLQDSRLNGHWAKIGARGTGASYAHTAALSNGDGTFTDLPTDSEYEWGTTTGLPAREVNGDTGVTAGTYVWVWPDPTNAGGYLFDGGSPGGGWFWAEVTGGSDAGGYSWKRKYLSAAATWSDATAPGPLTGTSNAYRPPSADATGIPAIPSGQVVAIRPSPTLAGSFEIGPWGGRQSVTVVTNVACVAGSIVVTTKTLYGRDLYIV